MLNVAVTPPPSVRDHRVVFLDLARAAAALMMIQGHTVDALLNPVYRTTAAFHAWTSIRGLTPSSFLFMAGFALAVVTWRTDQDARIQVAARRFRRFALFLCLGYGLHFPAGNLSGFVADAAEWRAFFAVDILQCVAVTLAGLQLLALTVRTPQKFLAGAFALAVLVLVLTWTTATAPPAVGPPPLRAYLSAAEGSLFPLLPWSAYAALGAAMGTWFHLSRAATPTTWTWRRLLPAGAVMCSAALAIRSLALEPPIGGARPSQFLLQAGVVCVILAVLSAVVAIGQRRSARVEAIARESLTVYFVHICIVYGSPWNTGLQQLLGKTLTPAATALCVVTMGSSMVVIAMSWNWCKRSRPGVAHRVRIATAVVLIGGLIL